MSDPIQLDELRADAEEWRNMAHSWKLKADQLSRELSAERALADRLKKAAKDLVDRWETPSWKDVQHTSKFIRSLDDALAAWKEARNE